MLRQIRVQGLYRDALADLFLRGFEDLAHAAFAEQARDTIATDRLADG